MEDEQSATISNPGIWAQVEIMGHRIRVGLVREVARFGRTMVEITRPELPALPAREERGSGYADDSYWSRIPGILRFPETPVMPREVEYYSPESLFCVKEISEGEVMLLLSKGRPKPEHEFIPDPVALAAIKAKDADDEGTDEAEGIEEDEV